MDLSDKKGSFVLLTDDPQETFEAFKEQYHHTHQEAYRVHYNEIFQLDDANEVVRLSYLQHDSSVWMIVGAKFYNEYAQNRLLKILEEPPKGVLFVLIALNKSALLPTIRSRLYVVDERTKKLPDSFPICIDTICLGDIYRFLKDISKKYPSKEEIKDYVAALLFAVKQSQIVLLEEDLDSFNKAIMLADQFERAEHIFAPLLLRILKCSQQLKNSRYEGKI